MFVAMVTTQGINEKNGTNGFLDEIGLLNKKIITGNNRRRAGQGAPSSAGNQGTGVAQVILEWYSRVVLLTGDRCRVGDTRVVLV